MESWKSCKDEDRDESLLHDDSDYPVVKCDHGNELLSSRGEPFAPLCGCRLTEDGQKRLG